VLKKRNLSVRFAESGVDNEEEPAEVAEWASFGLIFALAVLSFADARPRGFVLSIFPLVVEQIKRFPFSRFFSMLSYDSVWLKQYPAIKPE
jgi:hypothetical protein